MNRNQKIVLGVAAAGFTLLGLFPPWYGDQRFQPDWIFSDSFRGCTVNFTMLGLRWFILAVISGVAFFIASDSSTKP